MYNPDHPAFQLRHMSLNGPFEIWVHTYKWNRNTLKNPYDSYENVNTNCGSFNMSYGVNIVDALKSKCSGTEEAGISIVVSAKAYGQTQNMYIPAFDFAGDVLSDLGKNSSRGQELDELLENLSQMFPGNRLYMYHTGNSCHGYIPYLMDQNAFFSFTDALRKADKVVDQKWVAMGHMFLRWTTGADNRPRPTLKRTILL